MILHVNHLLVLMKYHALLVILKKRQNLKLSSAAMIIGGALSVHSLELCIGCKHRFF